MKKINWWAVFAFIVPLVIGYCLYLEQIKEIDPTFTQNVIKQNILSRALTEKAPIKIIKPSGEEIKANVYIQTFYFYNQGKAPMKREHILSPLYISLNDSTSEILEPKIIRLTRDITGIKLTKDSTNKNKVNIDFTILEEDDGIIGQITYVSNGNPDMMINGAIEGAPKGFSDAYKGKFGMFSEILKVLTIANLILFSTFIVWAALIISIVRKNKDNEETHNEITSGLSNEELRNRRMKRTLSSALTSRYDAIIRNSENFAEKASFRFTYPKLIIYAFAFFSIIFAISALLVRSVVDDVKKAPQQIEVPETLR
jgi:uncharacterized membrane protein